MKYNKDHIYSTSNTLEVSVSQIGSKAMIQSAGEDKGTMRQGYRVVVSGETVGYGECNTSKEELLLTTIKRERYAHLAYRELYYDLLHKLASIGLVMKEEDEDDRL